ncbi:SpoIIE family protein phosphatase [Nocardiopsis alkaliphila]|uniref:SpoIIE family protein phosphatase n=1 Tax=Nocardiopsis alkaliphila TaxID=225762 RepID=UPI00034A44AD|nr:SpoIIE family protein phosphatase [Nocardiopsis alkaliphila]
MDNDEAVYGGSTRPPNPENPPLSERIGLDAEPDESMECFASLATYLLQAPVAVSLAEEDRHILPGLAGLGEPWASARQVPLPHTEVSDTPSLDGLAQDPFASVAHVARALGAHTWIAAPLTDVDGTILGFVLAIDTATRIWGEREREALGELAHLCAAELILRLRVEENAKARTQARRAYDRSLLLMRTAEELAGTTDLTLIRRAAKTLITRDLGTVLVELMLVEGKLLRRVSDPEDPSHAAATDAECALNSDRPEAYAARTGTIVEVPDAAAIEGLPPEVRSAFHRTGLAGAVFLPLPVGPAPVATLVLGWDVPHEMDVAERALLRSLAEYAARAVERVSYVAGRVQAAHAMQKAMLPEIPHIEGLEIEALYRPAALGATVGGDWYDVYPLIDDESGTLAITVGDITGHDLQAAIFMGQVRTMLRQADLDHPGHGPARVLAALERANRDLDLGASGTLVHAHLKPLTEGWLLTWTNAGHMWPLVASADGRIERLNEHDPLFHPDLPVPPRTEHRLLLEPGSTLLMFTDGLVEHRDQDMDTFLAHTEHMLSAGRDRPLTELLRWIIEENVSEVREDDVALLAVRLKDEDPAAERHVRVAGSDHRSQYVTAPREAERTSFAYLPRTPSAGSSGKGFHRARRS